MSLAYVCRPNRIFTIWCYLIIILTYLLLMMPYGFTQHIEDLRTIEPTPALNLQEKELTTVLLVSNEVSDSYGRFRSLRPEVGLLTSTARTFIQNGVTTEYATQVVGTTLENGRVYAQYLKKSSRVLYESDAFPTVVTSWVGDSTILPQSHNDLYNAERPDWQDQDDRLRKVFVGNTDFIGELYENRIKEASLSDISNNAPSFPSQLPLVKTLPLNHINRHGHIEDSAKKLAAQKVLPIADLPTYTVKNSFSPSGFSWADITNNNKNTNISIINNEETETETKLEGRTPKLYYPKLMNSEESKVSHVSNFLQKRKLATTTYYGFADFTTVVGDSVIVFSPSSSTQQIHLGQVTSIKGEATLSDLSSSIINSYVPIAITEDFELTTPSSTHENQMLSTPTLTSIIESFTASESESDLNASNIAEISEKNQLQISTTEQIISISSDPVVKIPSVLSKPSDEEVSAIFSLLQKSVEISKKNTIDESEHISLMSNEPSTTAIEPSSLATLGGATTIFFEEDPFANFVDPTTSAGHDLSSHDMEESIKKETETLTDSYVENIHSIVIATSSPSLTESSITESSITESSIAQSEYSIVSSRESIQVEKTSSFIPTITKSGVVIKELLDNEADLLDGTECLRTSQVFLTQLPKIISYFTTYFTSAIDISSSIETNTVNTFDIVETTKNYCIQSTPVLQTSTSSVTSSVPVTEKSFDEKDIATILNEATTISDQNALEEELETTTSSDSEIELSSGDGSIDEDGEDESAEELELIYKTLYTTYTYLTTIFQESTSSILSHTEVITNVVTSTFGFTESSSTEQLKPEIMPTTILSSSSENKYTVLNNLNSIIREEEDSLEEQDDDSKSSLLVTPTEETDELELSTFHTTYTYFTTIFTEGETEIISRTEVLTNIITAKSSRAYDSSTTSSTENVENSNAYNASFVTQTFTPNNNNIEASSAFPLNYSTMIRNASVTSLSPDLPDFENYTSIMLVTDVRSSSSNGEGHVITDKIPRAHNYSSAEQQLIDDQISSESNTEEIIPSATLLLQTSFTTFTYYTTMYNANNTNVISRLETVTNVVTETLNPTAKYSNSNFEEATLPVTYFTTFTYWTKLAKDGIISTLSREETISNVITPSSVEHIGTSTLSTTLSENTGMPSVGNTSHDVLISTETTEIEKTTATVNPLEPTTYYTTYTYYTTSYESDNTITNSRFETITNVVTPTISLSSLVVSTATDSSKVVENAEKKNALLFYDYKKIIDADGVSTLFFETQVSPSINENGNPIEVTSSTSSLYIDESRKIAVSTPSLSVTTNAEGSTVPVRQYKTGLVRLIEGTRIGNYTTTLYQSRVIGTLIDNRYAQIIESTSSFLFEKLSSSLIDLAPSKTENYKLEATHEIGVNPSNTVLESSTGDSADSDQQSADDEVKQLEDDEDEDEDQNNKARLPFQSKKRTFTPVIRPFASRNRPQFAPKKKTGIASSATIITRSDFTPTITATPALKSTGRFSSLRKSSGSSINNVFGSSSSKRFGRPGKFSTSANQVLSTGSAIPNSSNFSGSRNRFGVSSRGTSLQGTSSRRLNSLSRSSTLGSGSFRPGFSSGYNSNARFRIKPTTSLASVQSSNPTELLTTPSTDIEDTEEEGSTQETNEEEGEATTENLRRNQNPLLRFRRPLTRPNESISPANNQRAPGSPNNLVSARRNPLATRAKSSTSSTTTTSTTPRSRPRGFQRPTIAALAGRQRPQSNLFPPRGLFQIQKQDGISNTLNKNGESENAGTENTEGDDDTDYDEDEGEEGEGDGEGDSSERKRRSNNQLSNKKAAKTLKSVPKTVERRRRSKREADVSYPPRSNFRSRFRRPKTIGSASTEDRKIEDEDTVEISTQQPATRPGRKSARFGTKQHTPLPSTTAVAVSHRGIRPTRPNNGRAQFTLREKDITTTTKSYQRHNAGSFRRPQTTASSRRAPTAISSNRRLKAYTNNNIVTEGTHRSGNTASRMRGNSLNSGRSRPSASRARNRNEYNMDQAANVFDGTITVTHVIPSEVTIPVVNGQVTEYKNVITAKSSTEIVSPQQYTSYIGTNGQTTLALTREETMTNVAGATEITQFILHGSPTSTVTFTPTTIRGRKTSFSHILPSTVYSVEKFVSTMQPQLANAPLANILLSQLLLGNIGLPGQPAANPLLGALNQPLITTQAPLTPVTEYRTHTSTYVTTIVEGMSTVVPVTFQGKKILTTVFDTSAQVITATEFITDTIVTTPVQQQATQPAQVNSLLLQQLLLQQQLQPQQTQDILTQTTLKEFLQPEPNLQELESNNIQDREDDMDIAQVEETQLLKATTARKKQRKSGKSGHRRNKSQGAAPKVESSVITLYVSGRRPGEFSTILSTVQKGDSTLQKREANIDVEKTVTINDGLDLYAAEGTFNNPFRSHSNLKGYKLLHQQITFPISKQKSNEISSKKAVGKTTQIQITSTEEDNPTDILPTPLLTLNIPGESLNYTKSTEGNFTDGGNMENFEEARYNLATRIMSNGVEVIIAGDKSKPPDGSQSLNSFYKEELQIVPHQVKKPMTLAPSTLKNQMILLVPNNLKEDFALPINTNQFVTKTCLTTYTYRTTYLQDGQTMVESREKVIANIATEERNYPKINSTLSMGVTLTRTPLLAVGVFPTTYSYYYTLSNGESSKILTSDHTVLNTITAPDDYILFLQPSESATPVFDTNTYLNKVFISKTLDDGGVLKVISNSETLTQVIVTESLPPRSTSVLTSYYAFDIDETLSQAYLSNYVPHTDDSYLNMPLEVPTEADYNMHIYATKTFLTTFTYVTTTTAPLFKSSSVKQASLIVQSEPMLTTAVNYYTQIIENVITEPVPTSLLSPELITKFRKEFKRAKNQRSIVVTLATLLGGQTLKITAMNSYMMSSKNHLANLTKPSIEISATQNLSNTIYTIPDKDKELEKSALVHRNLTKFVDSNAVASEQDSYYESSELKPAVIGIKPQLVNKNLTKIKTATEAIGTQLPQLPTNMNNIFGSLNLNGFTVLRPVFNAMADLLQSQFVSNANNKTDNKNSIYNIATSSKHENNHESPIYIPVQNSLEQSKKNYIFYNTDGSQITEGSNSNIDFVRLTPPQSLHIKPPEADLTISEDNWMHGMHKGNNFNQQPLINGGIPIRPGEIITANSDVIVGKPNGIQQPKVYTLQSNLIPLRHGTTEESYSVLPKNALYYEQQKHQQNPFHQTFSVPQNYKYTTLKATENYDNILRPPPLPASLLSNKLRPRPSLNYSLTSLAPPIRHLNYTTHSMDKSLDSKVVSVHHKHLPKLQNINNELRDNEIIDIKRMPQIFSTDVLPEVPQVPQNKFQLRLSSPYRNSSSPNADTKTKEFKHQSKLMMPPFRTDTLSVTPFTPNLLHHSNHQRINLQTNVLNHNIAINVPPLTFKKESLATSVLHGIPSSSGQLVMPHINIPPNEVEVQVNLTPQHSISAAQHHNLLNYLPNMANKAIFNENKNKNTLENHVAPINMLPKLNRNSEFKSYEHAQSHLDKYTERNHFDTLNIPIENVVKVIKPTAVFKSYYQIKPTIFTAPDATDNWDTAWGQEEINTRNNFKTIDQVGAFSFLKNQLHVPQHSNSLSEFNIPNQGQNNNNKNKKTTYPLLNPLTALQVNHLDETSTFKFKNDSSFELQAIKKKANNLSVENNLQNITISSSIAEKSSAKRQDDDIYSKTLLLSSSTPVLKLDENWQMHDLSNVNQNATKYLGQPFVQNLLKSDIKKKIPIQYQRTHPYNNFFIATGEGFKLNNKPSYQNNNNNITEVHLPLATEIQFQNKFNASKFELPRPSFKQTSNFSKQHVSSTRQNKHTTDLPKPLQATPISKSISSLHFPRSSASASVGVGLNPPPLLPKKPYTSVKNIYYKTLESTTTQNPSKQSVSAKPFVKSNHYTYTSLTSLTNDSKENWRHSYLKETISSTTKTKSSTFVISSNVHLSKSLIHTKVPELSPELPRTTDSYLTIMSNSKQSLNPQIAMNDFEVVDKYNSVPRKNSQIVLEPSMDFPNPLLTLSNEYIPTILMSSTLAKKPNSDSKHTTAHSSQDSKRSTLPLEQIVQLTKFITNTVTTTKTTISTTTIKNGREKIQSNVKTTTFHLTTTFTTTIVDTVTETHTLIEPTRISNSNNFATALNTTTTTEYKLPVPNEDFHAQSENENAKSDQQIEKVYKSVNNNSLSSVDRDNIFIVMTNRQGAQNIRDDLADTLLNPNEDYSEEIDLEPATRDEELFLGSEDKINNILLGGVLIATSNNSNILKAQAVDKESMISSEQQTKTTECRPACKTSRNELCKNSGCVCRPGFARMFPDRPCRPTYTYTMRIVIKRIGDFELMFNKSLSDNSSKDFRELAAISHDAIDRMVMQSDFRDVYHGVYIESFSTDNTNHPLIANILLQFSDINDEKRLEDGFKKYLRVNGYNIGLTELYTDKKGAEMLTVLDFNECNHPNFHDCSANAQCFNLKGTYTCSCNDGYIDLSENLVFPGRLCSAEIIGCEKCHFHGQCVPISKTMTTTMTMIKEDLIVCECFAWYSGSLCQLNLKILLIVLMAVGTVLFVILLICILLTCMNHREPKKPSLSSVFGGAQNIRPKQSSLIGIRVNTKNGSKATSFLKNFKPDKLVMIVDTSSESSDSSLPYVLKDSIPSKSKLKQQCNKQAVENSETSDCIRVIKEPLAQYSQRSHLKTSYPNYYAETGESTVLPTFEPFQGAVFTEIEQSDRSLTVMIPRAKYHPSVLPQPKLLHHQLTLERTKTSSSNPQQPIETLTESIRGEKKCILTTDNSSAGALVSAGFEVSAVVNENALYPHTKNSNAKTIAFTHDHVTDNRQYGIAKVNELNVNKDNDCHILSYNVYKSDDSQNTMDEWLDSIQQMASSGEGQSFGDSMILLTECDKRERDNQTINTNEEANTMAERDIGSTFLLPHTHLYKPERESDVSGLDSM